jgi:hypothetical protein
MFKIQQNSFLMLMQRRRSFVVMVKGSNAYKMLLRHLPQVNNVIEYSDLDIIVFINPTLDDELFNQIKDSLVILISQVLSRYKKDLDATFFGNGENVNETILFKSYVKDFKDIYMTSLKTMTNTEDDKNVMLSPFENNKVRNFCSKKSFIILNSETKQDHVVRVEVPHLPKCEFIPLRKTPIVLSHNKTIEFERDVEGLYLAHFELLRLRLNNMLFSQESDEDLSKDIEQSPEAINNSNEENDSNQYYDFKRCKVVPADFIDVCIPCKDDAELLDFWSSGGFRRCYEIYDKFVGTNIMIPNINECIRDLSNILNVYTNSHMKIEKRQKRLEMFKLLDENRKKSYLQEDIS